MLDRNNKGSKYKNICLLLLIVHMIGQFGIIGYATVSENISETEYGEKNNHEYDSEWDPDRYEVMRDIPLYYDYFMDKFAKQENIPEMISRQERWMLIFDHEQESTMIVEPSSGGVCGTINEEKWRIFIQYMESPQLLFGDAIVVRNCYCLHGTNGYMGMDDKYVYYETDIGDYVLYCHFNDVDQLYLVPLPVMQEYAKSVISRMTENQSLWGLYAQAVTDEDLCLVASYDIKRPNYVAPSLVDFEQSVKQTQADTKHESDDESIQKGFSYVLQSPYLYLFCLFVALIAGFNFWLLKKTRN